MDQRGYDVIKESLEKVSDFLIRGQTPVEWSNRKATWTRHKLQKLKVRCR
ncbi:hypothetical protein L798_10464 [Zootermopsis nevadensis]|uniref:Uncharacterized protein n=1 Tax=Zootermopsis nevadensis TaxID=136037 RepID=A0A067QYG3_ZOONE|nr:hypothetical protein L798_10464 [Zootermopsis nevadensis]